VVLAGVCALSGACDKHGGPPGAADAAGHPVGLLVDASPGDDGAAAARGRACLPLSAPPQMASKELRTKARFVVEARYAASASGDSAVDGQMNAIVEDDLRRRQGEFIAMAQRVLENEHANARPLGSEPISDEVQCDPTVVTRSFVGLACVEHSLVAGAYDARTPFAYNFALCAGAGVTPVAADALCRDVGTCKRRLSALLAAKVRAGPGGGLPVMLDDDVFRHFVVMPSGLRFFAGDPSPHGPDAAFVDLPFAEVADVLRRGGPLAGLF
jgi:hypothetical protein